MAHSSTTFQPKWNHGKTKVIRVPEVFSERILDYARMIDQHPELSVNESPQLYLNGTPPVDRTKPVNISKIIHRSPFRYPGGKTWFIPYLRRWLSSLSVTPEVFIEPFAGGGICALTVAFEAWAKHVLFSELDESIAAVWQTILTVQSGWLAEKIRSFALTQETVNTELKRGEVGARLSLKERAFVTILRNRVQRGGIMAPGAGLVKHGENGRGLGSRWYADTLAKRISDIATVRDRLTFEHTDGFNIIERFRDDSKAVYFADPPYTKAARRLYHHWEFDHRRLFKTFQQISGDFLLTYDNTDEIKMLAKEFGFTFAEIAMKNTHHANMTELVIGKDLSWLDAKT